MWLLGLLIWLAQAALFGYACCSIVENKGYDAGNWFWWGFFFGIFALLVALSKPDVNYDYVYSAESSSGPSSLSDAEGTWTCSCGRTNYAYSNACAQCGKLKSEALKEQSSKKIAATSRAKLDEDQVIKYLRDYKDLLDEGVISQVEYERKKNQLLSAQSKA